MTTYTGQPTNVSLVQDGNDVGAANPLVVAGSISTALVTGQLAVTATAQALGSATAYKNGIAVTNLSSGAVSIFIGPTGVTTSTGFELQVGSSLVLPVQDLSKIFVIASTTGSTISWIGL